MKRWKNMAAFFLALALVANMLFAGKIVAEADEMEEISNLSKVTGVRVFPMGSSSDIYTSAPIKIEVDYTVPGGHSAYGVELFFAEESVDINDEDADVACYKQYLDENEIIKGNGTLTLLPTANNCYASDAPGTKILKRINFLSVNEDGYSDGGCSYIYVENGENKGQLQLYDAEDSPVDEYINGSSFEVKERYNFMKINSLDLQPQKSQVTIEDKVTLKIGLQNYTNQPITIPAYEDYESEQYAEVWYRFIPVGSTDEDDKDDCYYYFMGEATIPANDSGILEIPMTFQQAGIYEIQAINIVLDGQSLNYCMEYGNKLALYGDGYLIHAVNLDDKIVNVTVINEKDDSDNESENKNTDEAEGLKGVVSVDSVQFVDEEGEPVSSRNLTFTAGEESQVQAVLCVKNNTNKDYIFNSDDSYITWTIPQDIIPDSLFKGSFCSMKAANDESIDCIPVNGVAYIYYDLDIDKDIIPGNAELSKIYLVGNAVDSDIELRTGYYKYEDEMEGFFEIGDEDPTALESLAYGTVSDFLVVNLNADTEAPYISNLSKITGDPIYTGTEIAFSASYSDDKSNVEDITMIFEGKDGRKLIGEAYILSDEGDYAEFGQSANDETIYVSFDSKYRIITGEFTLKEIEITDSWGNVRMYSDENPEGKQTDTFSMESNNKKGADVFEKIASVVEDENTTTWTVWKAACGFERLLYKDGVQITDVTLGADLNKNAVVPGTKFNANVTVKNGSGTDYMVGYSQICWEGPVDEDDCPTEICASQQNQFVIPSGQSGIISIPIQLKKDEINGKRILSEIYFSKSYEGDNNFETAISCELIDGKYYTFYGSNLTGIADPNADFTVGTPAVVPVNPSGNTQNLTSNTTGNTNSGTPAEVINRKLKGTKNISLKPAKKKVVVKWKKQTKKTKGYQLQYSTDKKFQTGVKAKTINGNKKTSTTLKGLKSKKTYYVRIRTWQKTSTGKAYSTWSKVKKAKVK